MPETITSCFRVYGIVQGVGFRPTVSRHGAAAQVTGSVSNKGPYVEIFAQGPAENVEKFRQLLENEPPVRSVILKIKEYPAENAPIFDKFSIIESEKTKGEIYIPPDIAICEDCRREMYDPDNKRYLHPFINCTNCGPRMTILDSLPYDRERTSMKEFPMCPDCAAEYTSPGNRRYDAQPVCCNNCGPEVYILNNIPAASGPFRTYAAYSGTTDIKAYHAQGHALRGREAITYTRKIIADGGIAAIKGIGGFHLCCDALNSKAVSLLRSRKSRPAKPFAVMAGNLEAARRECDINEFQEKILCGHQKPILLLNKKKGGRICSECAPDNPKLGIMLPYAPLQLLLFDYDDDIRMPDCLVMTSANTSGAPICKDDDEALEELGPLCDCILSHNRKIRIRADDSVMDFYKGKPYMVRRSRGYAPLPVPVSAGFRGQVLGIGGELKNEFCIGKDDLFYISPYVGDLEDLRTVNALKETTARFEGLLEAEPSLTGCDMHPLYNSTAAAKSMGRPVCEIQHHYAHVLSCMAENDCFEKVIGVSFDGTGYGTDGTIWGGEILLSDLNGFKRCAHISPFLQTGGDISAKEGWRIAAAMIIENCSSSGKPQEMIPKDAQNAGTALDAIVDLGLCSAKQAKTLAAMIRNNINTICSTSCGRLFDAVSAILGIKRISTFEGEAANALMFKAMEYDARSSRHQQNTCMAPSRQHFDLNPQDCGKHPETFAPVPGRECSPMILPTDRLVQNIIEKKLSGEDTAYLAYFFHRSLADMIVQACTNIRKKACINTVCLTGGVFQNTLLLGMCDDALTDDGFKVLTHHLVPPNDGGIALGQAVYAMNKTTNARRAELSAAMKT